MKGSPSLAPQLLVLHDIVSGQMDADRTDYLLRDSLHCGVDYGRFDYRRLIECLALYEDDEMGKLQIALYRDGLHAFESLVLARYQMNAQVYYHRLRRIYDHYLNEYFRALANEGELSRMPEAVLAENDVTMLARIFQDAERGDGARGRWAKRIRDRNHHRVIYDTGDDANYKDVDVLRRIMKKLGNEFDVDLIHDVSHVNIHKLATPSDPQREDKFVMKLLGYGNIEEGDVGERSQVLRTIPRDFQCGRIYADVHGRGDELRKKMTEFARQEARR